MPSRNRRTKLPSPFLKKIFIREGNLDRDKGYPFNLPWLEDDEFEITFTAPVTIFVGENGAGKSTLIEAIAALCGYDEAGGGKGYIPVDHSGAVDRSGSHLSEALTASWLPKVTHGWFFKAETFFSVARYLDQAALEANAAPPDYLSWSHGEGFVQFFEERFSRQGIFFMDEPESALSPRRQLDLIRILNRIHQGSHAQVIMATHSPLLMAFPHARLIQITRKGLFDITFEDTEHYKLYRDFIADPLTFMEEAMNDE